MGQVNYLAVLSTGIAVAGAIAETFEGFEEGAPSITVPPIRTYLGADHVEIDIVVKHLDVPAPALNAPLSPA